MLLAILLPVQGVALVLDEAWRPAHYHRHVPMPIGSAMSSELLREDTVLARLSEGPPAGVTAQRTDGGKGDGPSSLQAHHHGIDHHQHAFNDPDVVYVDDEGQTGESPRQASNGMVMLGPEWPPLMARIRACSQHPEILLAYESRSAHPLDRPPR